MASSYTASAVAAVSQSERQYILQGCRDDCRVDGRQRSEFRPYHCVVNDICLSYGSARVFLPSGSTHIIVSVKAELVIPPSTITTTTTTTSTTETKSSFGRGRNEEGVIDVHVDFIHGKNNRSAEEDLQSTLSTLLVPHLVDLKRLCVSPDHYVWKLDIDVLVIASGGGSLVDACSLGIKSALERTLLPNITLVAAAEGSTVGRPTIQVDSDIRSAKPIPGIFSDGGHRIRISTIPTIVTVSILRDDQKSPLLIVDATGEEESCSFAQVHVVLQQPQPSQQKQKSSSLSSPNEPTICALHKAGGGMVPFGILQDVTSFAVKASSLAASRNGVVVKETQSLYHLLQDNFDIQ